MSATLIVILIIIGLILVLAEVIVIPGSTVVGFLGCGAIGVAVWGIYNLYGNSYGHIALAITLIMFAVMVYFALKPKTWKRVSLHASLDNKVNTIDESQIKVGDTGITISRLAPMGKALINNETYEVSSMGEFINEKSEIEIIRIEGNKIMVKLKS